MKRMEESREYGVVGSSTEGHVSLPQDCRLKIDNKYSRIKIECSNGIYAKIFNEAISGCKAHKMRRKQTYGEL